jgi:hypothetical protein
MKIFWSWQSDHPGAVSRHVVREALELAVTSLNQDLAIEEPEREVSLDHDRKGVPGSPDLASIILEKIRTSDVFVADVTPVGATPNDPPKKLMNPNVAIELGYALHTITDRRLIMVMNTAFGSRRDLPFDLQHKAGPIFYELPADAAKEQIKEARKRLIADLKVALREMLPLALRAAAPAFTPTPARPSDPSRYFECGQTLATRSRGIRKDAPDIFTAEETPTLYLRIMPTRHVEPLKRVEAYDLIRQGPVFLSPFYYGHSGSGFEANEFGAIAFDAVYDKKLIVSAAQLFLNREIWAFNTVSLSPDLARARNNRLGVPTLSVERTFAITLREYLAFMNEKLGVTPPYRIEGGASGIKDYVLFMPGNFWEQQWGPVQQDHVVWSGVLGSLEAAQVDAILLRNFEAFFDYY